MTGNEKFLNQRQHYQLVILLQDFSNEKMVGDRTFSETDQQEITKCRSH